MDLDNSIVIYFLKLGDKFSQDLFFCPSFKIVTNVVRDQSIGGDCKIRKKTAAAISRMMIKDRMLSTRYIVFLGCYFSVRVANLIKLIWYLQKLA